MKVELKPVWSWDCEECGRENFARSFTTEMHVDEVREMMSEENEDEDDEDIICGILIEHIPDEVTCKHCGAMFETLDYGEEDEEEGYPDE